jgi:hypothetical protein
VVCVCSTHRCQSSGYDDLQTQAAVDEERSEFEAAFRLRFTMADAIVDAERPSKWRLLSIVPSVLWMPTMCLNWASWLLGSLSVVCSCGE